MAVDSDPLDWRVDEVVDFLCNPNLAPWALSANSSRPDLVALAAALRANEIGGEALLYDVDSQAIKDDLGVKALGHRSSVNRAIEWLRARSRKYQISKPKAPLPEIHSTESPLIGPACPPHQPQTPLATFLETASTEPVTPFNPTAPPLPLQTVRGKRKVAPSIVPDFRKQNCPPNGARLPNQQTSSLSLSSEPSLKSQAGQSSEFIFSEQDQFQTDAKHQAFYDKLLQKYPPGGAVEENDKVLPRYGESGSEASFDSETWDEIVDDNPELKSGKPSADDAKLSQQNVDSIVSQYIAEQEEHWRTNRLPRKLSLARFFWLKAQRDGSVKSESSDRFHHLQSRLNSLRTAIHEVEYRSRAGIDKSCMAMELTIFDLCTERWKLSVMNSDICPPAVSPPPRAPRSQKQRLSSEDAQNDESDKSEDLGELSDSEDFYESDGLTDFIVSDSEEQNAQRLPTEHGASDHGESRSPVHKRPRITEDEGTETVDARAGFSLVSSQPEEGLEIVDLTETRSGSVVDMSPPATLLSTSPAHASATPHSQDVDDMEIETPPLNPNPSPAPQDADMELDLSLDSPLIDPVSETRISSPNPLSPLTNPDDPLQVKVGDQYSRSLPHTTASDKTLPVNRDDIDLIDTVSNLSYKKVVFSKNRIQLLAKTIMNLRPDELMSYPTLLDKMIEFAYTDLVQEALRAMILNQSQLQMGVTSSIENAFAMRMGAMFLSWHHCVLLDPAGLPRGLISEALEAIKDDNQMFENFLRRVKTLILATHAWNQENPSRKPSYGEKGGGMPSNTRPTSNSAGENANKRRPAGRPAGRGLSTQQKDAQKRLKRQETARAELERERERKGLSISDPAGQAVTFKEPIIYLHPELGKFVKPHQLMGIQFMWRELIEATNSQGCLLAHVMGLGKTFQVICLLVTIAAAAASDDPKIREQIPRKFHRSQTFVLCPSSLVENWIDEFAIWAPRDHKVGAIRGIYPRGKSDELFERFEQIKAWNAEGGVLIMSYEMFRNLIQNKSTKVGRVLNSEEHELLQECLLSGPNIIVADEAHKLKSDKSAISQIASRFKTTNRIAMTGSPLANHLSEYYQMVEWISPGYLENPQSFKTKFMDPIQAGSWMDSTKAEQRENTSAIASELPHKTEFIICVPLTGLQKSLYNTFVTCLKASQETDAATKLWTWLALLQLCCNHPYPFREKLADRSNQLTDDPSDSLEGDNTASVLPRSIRDAGLPSNLFPNIEALFKQIEKPLDPVFSHRSTLLNQILDESMKVEDKVLVFSQSIPTMDYLDDLLERSGRKYLRIDGKTLGADRQMLCKRFNATDSEQVLLISTRAGGLGLNIFGANRVVIFDFLFNPTWEEQAIGRAYRLGQKKPVFVYRFVAGGTFEDKIFNTAVFKSQLAVRVVDKKNVIREGAKKTEEYLKPVRDVDKENYDAIMGKDPQVLDKILVGHFGDIVLKVTLSHIQDNEHDRLTDEERERVADQLFMEQLKRSDRSAFEAETERRRMVLAEKQRIENEHRRQVLLLTAQQQEQALEQHRQRLQFQHWQNQQWQSDVRQHAQGLPYMMQRDHVSQVSLPSHHNGVTGPMQTIPYMPTAMSLLQRTQHAASMSPVRYLPSSVSMNQPHLTNNLAPAAVSISPVGYLPSMHQPRAALANGQSAGSLRAAIFHNGYGPPTAASAYTVTPPVPGASPVPGHNPSVATNQHPVPPACHINATSPGNDRPVHDVPTPSTPDVFTQFTPDAAGSGVFHPTSSSPGEPIEISDDDKYPLRMDTGENDAYSPPPNFPPL
ncbi:uncharacterized protein N7498_010683 [Penicillium cinerascens]|uniref:SNF2 family helicase/ATPase n=1 Tax=Penicillium cinerascens TaxID=70096 RepID=A0A9W9J6W7_9EURO|nr:uncharacterized protein N7498_010683 [Penicillium cinerascens]KAJ5191698.1 hypothetical protein N7498_010683 [Penicillium cinerascens]